MLQCLCEILIVNTFLSRTHCHLNYTAIPVPVRLCLSHIKFADLFVIISIRFEISGKIKTKEHLFSLSGAFGKMYLPCVFVYACMRAREKDRLFFHLHFFILCVCTRACVYFSMGNVSSQLFYSTQCNI